MFCFHHQDVLIYTEILHAFEAYESSGAPDASPEGRMFGFARFYYAGRFGRFVGITGDEAKAKQATAMLACITVCNLAAKGVPRNVLHESHLLLKHSITPYDVQGPVTFLGILAGFFHAEEIDLNKISITRLARAHRKNGSRLSPAITGL